MLLFTISSVDSNPIESQLYLMKINKTVRQFELNLFVQEKRKASEQIELTVLWYDTQSSELMCVSVLVLVVIIGRFGEID